MTDRRRLIPVVTLMLAVTASVCAQTPDGLKPYVTEDAPYIVLDHVRVIDGTGAMPAENQRIEIANGRIVRIGGAGARRDYPAKARVLDLTGKTVIPGLVGMHEHLWYPTPDGVSDGVPLYSELADSAPRLYLAGGVTTARTAGSVEPYTDLGLKKLIDAGKKPGPKLDVTGPYIGDYLGELPQMHALTGPEDAARLVDYWAAEGVTSFKVYNSITRDELKAAIERAHAHGLKITGHLCSVGFREAAALGIDNLEHGIVVDTEFFPGKQPDACPDGGAVDDDLAKNVDIGGEAVAQTIRELVRHHVAVTSTLAVFETFVANRPALGKQARVRTALTTEGWAEYLRVRGLIAERNDPRWATLLDKEMKFERAFVAAGGLLLAGCDPTGYGGVLPGYGDQRGIELLVEAGFTPVEAIHIATQNGATYLGRADTVGAVAAGKAADLVVLNGNPLEHIDAIESVDTVFKDGIGYDPAKLGRSVQGKVGLH